MYVYIYIYIAILSYMRQTSHQILLVHYHPIFADGNDET